MTFKPAIWFPIAVVLTLVNLGGAFYAANSTEAWHATTHAGLALAFGLWAQHLWRNRVKRPGGESAELKAQLDEQIAGLADAQALLESQANQLAELQERMDFTERVLAQVRERPALGVQEKRE